MVNVELIVPLVNFLGAEKNDEQLNNYLSVFGKKPNFKVIENTADLSYKEHGFSLSFFENKKNSYYMRGFFLYSQGYDGFEQYKGYLPAKIFFFEPRIVVQMKIGIPQKSGGGNKFKNIVFPFWDQYVFKTCVMRVSYTDNKVSLITFMSLNEAHRLGGDSVT